MPEIHDNSVATYSKLHRGLEFAACLFIGFMGWGTLQSFGAFLPYILDTYGESRALSSIVHSSIIGASFITGVVSGILVTKLGTGKTSFIGAVCLSGGFMVSFFATKMSILFVTIGVVAGIGESLTYVCSIVTTGRLFSGKGQTFFLVLQNAVSGIAGIVLPYFFDWLSLFYGLNGAFLVHGAILLNLAACAFLFHFSKKEMGDSDKTKQINTQTGVNENDRVKIPLKGLTFILFVLSETIAMSNLIGILVMYMDVLAFKHISHSQSLICLVAFNICSTLGRFLPILVNFRTKNPLYTLLISTSFGFIGQLFVLLSTSFPLILIGTAATGVSDGATISAVAVIVFKIVVPEAHSFGIGLIFTVIGIVSTGVPPLYGGIYDITDSYVPVLVISSSAYLVSAICAGGCIIAYERLRRQHT